MIALFLMGLLGATVILGGVPFVLFALMVESTTGAKAEGGSRSAVRGGARVARSGTGFGAASLA